MLNSNGNELDLEYVSAQCQMYRSMGPSNAHISFLDGIIIVSFVRPVQEAVRVSLLRQRDGKGVVVQALDPTAVDFGESEFQLPSLLSQGSAH